jgi:type IV pilus assembly protein PilV
MSNRIRANSAAAQDGDYTEGNQYGLLAEADCGDAAVIDTTAKRDLCEWNIALAGSGTVLDVEGVESNVGSIQGARGCLENIAGSSDGETIIRLTIAWQGLTPTQAPTSTCGKDQYGDDAYRRVVSLDTVLADLDNI